MRNLLILLSLNLILQNNLYAETSQNLVSQDFTQGWSGTNLSTNHGDGIIAGVHNGYVESDSVSLSNDVNLNENEIKNGFTVNSSGSVWFWNNYDQSITMTTKAIDSDGQTITQNKTLSGTCATWNGCGYGTMSDTMIFNSNTQTDYNLSLGFSFSVTDPLYQSGHYGADLKDPSMTVTYTPITINTEVETSLVNLSDNLKDDVKDIKIKEDEVMDTKSFDNTTTQTSTELQTEKLNDQDSTSMPSQEKPQEDNEVSSVETKSEEKEQENQTTENTESKTEESSDQEKSQESKLSLSFNKSISKVDSKINSVEVALKEENNQKLSAILGDSILLNYNVPFYKDKRIYGNQLNIIDNRKIYDTNLNIYVMNDPIASKEIVLNNIRLQKRKLLEELKVLKDG